ncbi:MAG TPA: 4Fe-4S binding protein [Propionibacterium sp.]|nr:4Fe-4S binding protein [Propionibacterium sp.]
MSENPKYPGTPTVVHGNGAVAHVMQHVCGGVIGYPITPSTEIAELFEAARASGAVNVFGRRPFFFEPEGEHSAQSGALGAALTGGQFISNASSSQGILYAMESHFVTVGKKVGGFVLQVAARVVSKHSLNVMAGHDDVYALLPSGYTVLFGANPQEAADLAAISYRTAALSLIPVANAMDGFSTSHMMSEARLPEPELLREYLGDPAGRIPCPTVAQEVVFGAKGRVHQLTRWLGAHADAFDPGRLAALRDHLAVGADAVEADDAGQGVADTLRWVPEALQAAWRRQWVNAFARGTRQLVPAFVDPHNPGLTGPVQNQPDFQAGAVDHRTHFAADVPALVRRAMDEYGALTGRRYAPVMTHDTEDADVVMVALGSVADDVRAVLPVLRAQGIRAGLVSVTCLQPFPDAELVAALAGKKAVLVLERSDQMALTQFVTASLLKGLDNARTERHPGVPALAALPEVSSAIFGLGGHDLQPRHLVAAFKALDAGGVPPLIYLGSQFFAHDPDPELAALQDRLRAAYPATASMALDTEPNPRLLPEDALRLRFHSVGGYGTIATGKLLTDILAGVLGMQSKSAPKYGSEKSGAATNYYITLSPEPVLVTNAELEEVEVVISPDHKVFSHTDPLKGLVEGGTFILQSSHTPEQAWRDLPTAARRTIRERRIWFLIIDAFAVAKRHAPDPNLQTRMMGIAFIGAVAAHVDRVARGDRDALMAKVREQIRAKFGRKGAAVVDANMAVVHDGAAAAQLVDHDSPELSAISDLAAPLPLRTVALSAQMADCGSTCASAGGLFDDSYYDLMTGKPFREGTIGEAPVLPGTGLFVPPGTAAGKDKGLFRRQVPDFQPELCTGCMECALVCPDAAIPNQAFELDALLATAVRGTGLPGAERQRVLDAVPALAAGVREQYLGHKKDAPAFADLVATVGEGLGDDLAAPLASVVDRLRTYPVARTRAFFDALEKRTPGAGGLFAATIDPWKCTGCLECVEICGPDALVAREQDPAMMGVLEDRFEFLTQAPNTPARFHEAALGQGGDIKRMLLDRENYYASTGGHGACRGCGEVTSIRLVVAASHALGTRRYAAQQQAISDTLDRLAAKQASLPAGDDERRARIASTLATLDRQLYLLEGGPTGSGPSSTVIANSTGCSSVYASTMPYNPYNDPWVNSLFQDAQPLAKGLFEGTSAHVVGTVAALRRAELELTDSWTPQAEEALSHLGWQQFTDEELGMLPTFLTIGGDGATYDIGFGALSRVLSSGTPIKAMVLNTGSYSNTGGQASTASFTAQDSDLARSGAVGRGKTEARKELGLIAALHPDVYVVQTAASFQAHFLKNAVEFLEYTDGPALMDVYTPCQGEQGIADEQAANRGRLAVRSRMSPLFVHDPRRGASLPERLSLAGNPDLDAPWVTQRLDHVADDGSRQVLHVPLTPADFALGEARFRSQFRPLRDDEDAAATPIHAYVELGPEDRAGRVPFVWSTDADLRLVRTACAPPIVALVEERQRNWQQLRFLAGRPDA